MMAYEKIMDRLSNERKSSVAGQMSLFDFVEEEDRQDFEELPKAGEFDRETLLAFEKEVLGVYTSGHPLEQYEALISKHTDCDTVDFLNDPETGKAALPDNSTHTVGGMITQITMKYTRNNQAMAFFMLEDLTGTVEVIVFPKTFERVRDFLAQDARIFVTGRVQADEKKDAKLIAERIRLFSDLPKTLWLQFSTKEEYRAAEEELFSILSRFPGEDGVKIYISSAKALKPLPKSRNIRADSALLSELKERYGEENVKLVEN